MDATEKLLILGVGAFLGARYLAGRITNNSGGNVLVNPKPELPKVEAPKNTGIVPPNFTPPSGFTGAFPEGGSLVDDGILNQGQNSKLMQELRKFQTVFK